MSLIAVLAALLAPVAYAAIRARVMGREEFLVNAGRAGLVQMTASIICGNVGIGTFVALILFSAQSPILGLAIALAYAAGLLLCAALAGRIHHAARVSGTHGMVDYLVAIHGVRRPLAIWLPVAVAFGLRTTLQLMALGLIVEVALGLAPVPALLLGGALVAAYTTLGGYRVATETDVPQAAILLAGMALIGWVLWQDGTVPPPGAPAFWSFGPWGPALLVGIVLFLPVTAVMGIDNWQRIATAPSPRHARRAFVLAALICGAAYLLLFHIGRVTGTPGGAGMADVVATLRALMPQGAAWVADVAIVAAVVSSVDTYVVPLMSVLARGQWGLGRIRLAVLAVFAVLLGLAWGLGDVLTGVIAVFNTLVVFLPAVMGALIWGDRAPRAATLSMGAGVIVSLATSALAPDVAGFAGFVASATLYLAFRPRRMV